MITCLWLKRNPGHDSVPWPEETLHYTYFPFGLCLIAITVWRTHFSEQTWKLQCILQGDCHVNGITKFEVSPFFHIFVCSTFCRHVHLWVPVFVYSFHQLLGQDTATQHFLQSFLRSNLVKTDSYQGHMKRRVHATVRHQNLYSC